MKIQQLIACLIAMSVYSTACGQFTIFDPDEYTRMNPYYNKSIPDHRMVTLRGDTIHISDYQNQLLVLHCWSLSCSACFKELPDFQKLMGEYFDTEVRFLSLMPEDTSKLSDVMVVSSDGYRLKRAVYKNDVIPFEVVPNAEPFLRQLLNADEPVSFPKTYFLERGVLKEIACGYYAFSYESTPEKTANYLHLRELIEKTLGSK
jgi:thiol-disulfide isomerase/thioredoxin